VLLPVLYLINRVKIMYKKISLLRFIRFVVSSCHSRSLLQAKRWIFIKLSVSIMPHHFRTSKFPAITNTNFQTVNASQVAAILVPQNKGFRNVL